MPRLSVNLNKIALLRNSRRTGVPDVLRFGRIAHASGADGLTGHPRPDERHIRRTDVFGLAELMRPWRPGFELNIEGYPDRRFLDLVTEVAPEQCTLVPDAPDVLTSEEGWKLSADDRRLLDPVIPALRAMRSRSSYLSTPTLPSSSGSVTPAPMGSKSTPAPMPRPIALAPLLTCCRLALRLRRALPSSG